MLTLLRALRMKASVSQAELASAAGVAQPMVSTWENGLQIPPDRAQLMLSYLSRVVDTTGITPEELSKPYADDSTASA